MEESLKHLETLGNYGGKSKDLETIGVTWENMVVLKLRFAL